MATTTVACMRTSTTLVRPRAADEPLPAGDTPCLTVCRREALETLLFGFLGEMSIPLWQEAFKDARRT
ncbi:hypothetical protein ABBQ38_000001 [Trebouxia sp. C0009 RCD-2024]